MDHLTRLGAREVIHFPGADEPGDPDRRLALSGLTGVDRLFSFEAAVAATSPE
ncbi:hypothetical protein [Streptomyces silvisoli]|uniref:Uncharacterized protein n=1 Tax=Streptomyces silvisoli TaxID=3034235 RepID=A0ABT5ZE69_9ACTN|nr:hypothetical protein [Streptomyces silvisoli]MDF3288121.1 hypothetical protein [Streptomyces silvisoli]